MMCKSIRFWALFTVCLLVACKESERQTNPIIEQGVAFDAPAADYELLFIGNSHSSVNGLPRLVARLIEAGTNQTAYADNAPGIGFLVDRQNDGVTQKAIDARNWSHIILQGQKYSTTGSVSYPTTGSKHWIRQAKAASAIPIMFPEWPRKNNFEEGERVHLLHLSIVMEEGACVAPVGLAWDRAIATLDGVALHHPDGNHSSLAGALLAAYVFYQTITEQRAADLPYIASIAVDVELQKELALIASALVSENPPCAYFN